MTDNFGEAPTRRSITLEEPRVDGLQEGLDQLRLEIAELRASRRRLVLAADADRRTIERDLHENVQQLLVALAVNLQLARQAADTDPAATKGLLDEMGRDVKQALDETGRLSQRIYRPLLDARSLTAAMRSAAVSAGIRASVQVAAGTACPAEVAATVYLCWLEALEQAGAGARATVTVRDEEGALAFELVEDCARSDAELDPLRDRVEALGGRLTIRPEPGGATRISGSLPLSR